MDEQLVCFQLFLISSECEFVISTRCLVCWHSAVNMWFWGPGWSGICGLRSDNVSSNTVLWSIDLDVLGDYARSKRLLGSDIPKGKKNFFKSETQSTCILGAKRLNFEDIFRARNTKSELCLDAVPKQIYRYQLKGPSEETL